MGKHPHKFLNRYHFRYSCYHRLFAHHKLGKMGKGTERHFPKKPLCRLGHCLAKLLDTIYSPIKSLVEDNREYVSKLVELQDLDNEEQQCQIKWCIEPNDFIAQIGTMELLEKDIVSIELTGEELLNGEQHG